MARETPLPRFAPPQISPEISLGQYFPAGSRRLAAEQPKPAAPAAAVAAVEGALTRLEDIIDQESTALETHQPADLLDINRRKSHSLLELTRLTRQLPAGGEPRLKDRLAGLRARLDRNYSIVGLHLRAVREIADLMVDALSEAESDGTYGMAQPRRGVAR